MNRFRLGFVLITVSACALALPGAKERGTGIKELSEVQMSRLIGGDACHGCRLIDERKDECFHVACDDSCAPDSCIANYCIDYTCDLGYGDCWARLNYDNVGVVQYRREDDNCTTNNPNQWQVWITHYYDTTCQTFDLRVRCQKSNGGCDGSLIEIAERPPKIECNL